MYWGTLCATICRYVKSSNAFQHNKVTRCKIGKLPAKLAELLPWKSLCVDVVGIYTIKCTNNFKLDFVCLTMIDPATILFKIVEIPTVEILNKNGEK